MIKSIEPQLMFPGTAGEAMKLYLDAFGGRVIAEQHYPSDHPTQAGRVLRAVFQLGDQRIACIDTEDVHDFTFTPSMSIFVELDSAAELENVFGKLSRGGEILMPLDNYGFSDVFVWFNDRFGVSWQLNYAGED